MKGQAYIDALSLGAETVISKDSLRNKKILVTGATGLIGSAIVDLLAYINRMMDLKLIIYAAARTNEKAVSRFGQEREELQYINYQAEERFVFEEKVDFVIHCASNAHPSAFVKYPVETMTANIFGTQQLLEYVKRNGKGRLVLISSSEVYGEKKTASLYRENDFYYIDCMNPRACYPSGKRAAETLCACYQSEYQVDFVVVRPGHIYGPTMTGEDSRAFAQFARCALGEENIIMKSAGQQLRSYCYVMDCASAVLTVMLRGETGEAYNISNKDSIVTIRQLAEAFAMEAGCKVCFQIPDDNEKKGYNMMSCSALDSEKLEQLGWHGKYNLREGIHSMIEIMKESNI